MRTEWTWLVELRRPVGVATVAVAARSAVAASRVAAARFGTDTGHVSVCVKVIK